MVSIIDNFRLVVWLYKLKVIILLNMNVTHLPQFITSFTHVRRGKDYVTSTLNSVTLSRQVSFTFGGPAQRYALVSHYLLKRLL